MPSAENSEAGGPGVAPPDGVADQRAFVVFAVFWAMAALFHLEPVLLDGTARTVPQLGLAVVVCAAAVLVLWRPDAVPGLLLLAAAQIASVLLDLPEVSNHWLLTALANIMLLLVALAALVRRRALPRDGGALLSQVRGAGRAGVAIFYAFTCLWKLNRDFLDPQQSCAARGWASLAALYHLPANTTTGTIVVVATLVVEGVGPILLLLPATRVWTALVLVTFHLGLGLDLLHRYLNFSSTMFALLALGLSPEALARARRRLPALKHGRRAARWAAALWMLLIAALVCARHPEGQAALAQYLILRYCGFLLYGLGAVALFAAAAGGRRSRPVGIAAARRPTRWAWIFPALVLINGCGPLLGVRTRGSWQMYSNLRLEPDASNHLLFPRSLDLLDLMKDRVTVLQTSDSTLAGYSAAGLQVPWIMFRSRLARHPEASVRFRRGGREQSVARVADDPSLAVAPAWPQRALFFLRPLGDAVRTECLW